MTVSPRRLGAAAVWTDDAIERFFGSGAGLRIGLAHLMGLAGLGLDVLVFSVTFYLAFSDSTISGLFFLGRALNLKFTGLTQNLGQL